jgi:hypothetical protein
MNINQLERNINQLDEKKRGLEGPLVSLTISEVSILFILYYFVFMVSHYVSFNNPINPLSLLQSNRIKNENREISKKFRNR